MAKFKMISVKYDIVLIFTCNINTELEVCESVAASTD